MTVVSVDIPEAELEELDDKLAEDIRFDGRSGAIRYAIRKTFEVGKDGH